MANDDISFKEQLILIPMLVVLILATAACGVGYYFTEGELADSLAAYSAISGIAAISTAMFGHTVLGILQRVFSFKL